ncbi:MAG: zf-HC2 domain-containing protein [Desulfobacterales bacterium]|nr:zf-HC2 domain-containing protein [Desulfobacterales bacterium]
MTKICPDHEKIVDYMKDRLSQEDRIEVEAHLPDCDLCLESLLILKDFVKNTDLPDLKPVPMRVTQAAVQAVDLQYDSAAEKTGRVFKNIFSKVSDFFTEPIMPELEFGGVRDPNMPESGDYIIKTEKFMGMKIDYEKPGEKALVRISLDNNTAENRDIRATLVKDDRELCSELLNEQFLIFDELPPGSYNIIFARHGLEIGTYPFDIQK